MVDDPVDYGMVRDEGNDLHQPPAFGTDEGVGLIDLPDHLRPALGGNRPGVFLGHP